MPCRLCSQPKTIRECEFCQREICKNCVAYLEKDRFAFHPKPPKAFQYRTFCANCFADKIEPELKLYDEVLERSLEVEVIRSSYRGFVPLLRKAKAPYQVKKLPDENLAIAYLKFLAAWNGYNSVTALSTKGEKKRNYGYQTTEWSASGLFAELDKVRFRRTL